MQVVVDGTIFELSPHGGVARIFREILPRMCDLDPTLQVHLLSNRHSYGFEHPSITPMILMPPFERLLRPRRILAGIGGVAGNAVKRRATRHLNMTIWHPTYYTWLKGWHGPQIFTVYDLLYERYERLFSGYEDRLYRRQKRECLQRADIVLCISQTTADELQEYLDIPARKIHVTPLAASSMFRILDAQIAERPIPQPYFIYVGGRRHYKNFDRMLLAYSRWSRNHEVALVIVGSQLSMDERRQIAALGLNHRVHAFQTVSDADLCILYNRAEGLIYPSLYEGFGISLLEAALCGCPVIASRIPSTLEVLGDIPIYFEPTNVDEMIAAFEVAVTEGRQSERTFRGRERANGFSWEKTAEQTLDIYHDLTG